MNPFPCPTCGADDIRAARWRGFHYRYCRQCHRDGPPALNPHHAVVEWNGMRSEPKPPEKFSLSMDRVGSLAQHELFPE